MLPLVEELIPCPDPWDVACKFSHLPHLLFLDSNERHPDRGRYSYVMADPTGFADIDCDQISRSGWNPFQGFLSINFEARDSNVPFLGGLAGLWGYGLSRSVERLPKTRQDECKYADLAVGLYDTGVTFDHWTNRSWLFFGSKEKRDRILSAIRTPVPGAMPTALRRHVNHEDADMLTQSREHGTRKPICIKDRDLFSNFTREGYIAAIRRCIDYIRAGDAFQINLSQRLTTPLTEHPLELYGRMRQVCPAPFSCYFDAGEFQVLSASPERFLKVTPQREVITQPIKGTRPRGKTPEEDQRLIRDLTTSEKDRAENVMIVDLLRNDLGRVCEYGSIHVPRVCDVETYSHVHHLVSEVRGKLKADKTPFDLLQACFPGGSVTGAPKVRAIEIIAELEPTARGPYCGSVGFIGFDGAMDSNILIRTFTAGRGWLQFPVGGGIVADSDPEAEYEETLHKAAGLLKALKR